jgi:hypothetical protein
LQIAAGEHSGFTMNGFSIKLTWPAWYWLTAACFLAFVLVTWQVLGRGPHSFDMACAEYFKTHAAHNGWIRNILWTVTQFGSPWALGLLAGVAIGVLLLRKQRFLAVVWLLAVGGGASARRFPPQGSQSCWRANPTTD